MIGLVRPAAYVLVDRDDERHISEFGTTSGTAPKMVTERRSVISPTRISNRSFSIQILPPHPGVEEKLSRLSDAGSRLAALTNSTQRVADAQIDSLGLREYFAQVPSADPVQRLKPALKPYRRNPDPQFDLWDVEPAIVASDFQALAEKR